MTLVSSSGLQPLNCASHDESKNVPVHPLPLDSPWAPVWPDQCIWCRKAIIFVILSKYCLLWAVVWSCWAFPVGSSGPCSAPQGCTSGWLIPVQGVTGFLGIQQMDGWMDDLCDIVGNGVEMLIAQAWRCCCSSSPFAVSPLSGQGLLLCAAGGHGGCVSSNLPNQPGWRHQGWKTWVWQCWGKGRDSPQSRVITFCTAQHLPEWVAVSVPSSQGSPASRPEGPSRGGFSVLFQCILPPSSPNTSVFDVQGLGLAVLSLWGRLCSSRPCLQMNHGLLSTWVPLQAPDTVCEGCDPLQLSLLTEQVLLHTLGRVCKAFILQSSVTDPVLQLLLSLGLWEASCSEVGSTHQPVKGSRFLGCMEWSFSPCWEERWVLGRWHCCPWQLGWHSPSSLTPARGAGFPHCQSPASRGPG